MATFTAAIGDDHSGDDSYKVEAPNREQAIAKALEHAQSINPNWVVRTVNGVPV